MSPPSDEVRFEHLSVPQGLRVRYLSTSTPEVFGLIDRGVVFVMAWWSGPALSSFASLTKALAAEDPMGRFDLIVVDIDGAAELEGTPEFKGQLRGWGEAAWLVEGKMFAFEGAANPAGYRSIIRTLLAEPSG